MRKFSWFPASVIQIIFIYYLRLPFLEFIGNEGEDAFFHSVAIEILFLLDYFEFEI